MPVKRILLVLLMFTPFANAANWYVSKVATGTNAGTSWTNAWNEMGQVNWSTVACGDTIWLAGGTNYTTELQPHKTCTSGNVLSIKRVLSSDSVPVASPGWSSSFDSQVVIANNDVDFSSGAFITLDGRQGVVLSNNYGIKITCTASNGCGAVGGAESGNLTNITIQNVEMFGPSCVTGGTCTGGADGLNIAPSTNTVTNLLVHNCWIHQWAENMRASNWTGATVEYSDISVSQTTTDEHNDTFFSYDQVNLTMRYNRIYMSPNDGMFFNGNQTNTQIYGNTFFHSGGAIITWFTGFTHNVFVYNNVFENDGTYGDFQPGWLYFQGTVTGEIANNVFWQINKNGSCSVCNHNAYDISGQSTGETGSFTYTKNNQFVNLSTSNPPAADFHLTTTGNTTFVGGETLSAPFNMDADGNTRGGANGWTLGAFQNITGAPTVATPTSSPVAGTYVGSQTVTLATTTSGATICYTVDGTTPTAITPGTCSHGTPYTTGFVVSANTTVMAIGTLSGQTNSAVLTAAFVINHQTWYVRADGGTRTQCTGKTDAAYPGSGSAQNCGFNDMRWMYDNQTNNNWKANGSSWVMAGGDTLILESAANVPAVAGLQAASAGPPNRIGWDYGASCSGAGCASGFTWCFGVGQCGVPPPPAGTPSAPTHIWGANHGVCSTTTTFPGALGATTIPDPTKMFELYGDFGLNTTMDLTGTHDIDLQCVHITTHGDCMVHISPNTTIPCSTSMPLSSYSSEGLRSGPTTGTILLQDVWISGFQDSGWYGPINGTDTFNDVRMSYNVLTGFDMDDGTNPQAGGTVNAQGLILDFNGCNQKWPFVTTVPIDYCSDQSSAGDGDGAATPGSSSDTFNIDHLTAIYNTQDGFDVGHNQAPGSANWNHSIAYGNMGGTFKSGGESSSLINSFSNTNCYRMAASITGVPSTFNSVLSLFCRANGDGVTANWLGGGSSNVIKMQDNTIITYGGVAIDTQVQGAGSCTGCTFLFQGNTLLAYNNPSTGAPHNPGVFNLTSPGFGPTTTDHNTLFNFFGYTCAGTDQCVDPLFVSEPPPATPVGNGGLDAFNFNLSSSSPAKASQIPITGITDDFFAVTRLNPTSAGAAQFVGTTTVATPTASPVAGTYATGQSVTLSTTTAGATICYTTDGTTPTATPPGTCSHGTTYSSAITVSASQTILAIGTLSGDTNSSVGTFVYVISAKHSTTFNGSAVFNQSVVMN